MNNADEEWRPVPGFEETYEVSNTGQVRSVDREVTCRNGDIQHRKGRLRKGVLDKNGYPRVRLHSGGHGHSRYVHRLVLEAFRGEPPFPGVDGCHNDGDPTNNRVENLRWDTHSSNMYDVAKHGNHYQANKTHCNHNHPLIPMNLRRAAANQGFRMCLACHRASARIGQHEPGFRELADQKFADIAAGKSRLSRHASTPETHCPQGHLFDLANTARSSNGSRRCRECDRAYNRRRNQQKQGIAA
ncbi:NUMOD4 motif-containing HNH endonuclease [Nocardia halotolerans]|uniref:NUMOD4 motif-containing HNH endonuclease n=1 Tax=Nocardia halotolerans TaxID=1755878 RepID=A0ABV8VC27_9NOCA